MGAAGAKSAKILVVDDDRTWQVYLFSLLQSGYELRSAYSGDSALEVLQEFQPECILLDITMPGKSGYEVCRQLKKSPVTNQVPIIFLSSKGSMQEKVLGFELGADDYLVKTTESEVLKAKIARAVFQFRKWQDLSQSFTAAQSAAFEAMSGSADLGCCLRFVERTFLMDTYAKLADGIFNSLEEFGLRGSLMMLSTDAPLYFASSGHEVSPLEREMFIATHSEGRFCDFGDRTFCNYKLISLLIKNMPLDQPERYGRIKDAVPWIMSVADSRVAQLNSKLELLAQLSQAQVHLVEAQNLLIAPEGFAIEALSANLTQAQLSCANIENQLEREAETNALNTELGHSEVHSSSVDFF